MSRSKLWHPSALFPFESAAAVSSKIDLSCSAPLNLVAGDPLSQSVPLAFPRMGMAESCFKDDVFTSWASFFGYSGVVLLLSSTICVASLCGFARFHVADSNTGSTRCVSVFLSVLSGVVYTTRFPVSFTKLFASIVNASRGLTELRLSVPVARV